MFKMSGNGICCKFVIFLSLCISFQLALATEVQRPRGVPLSKSSLYNPDNDFTCLDGSLTIPFKYVNDDYCDCPDGSDEPGTSACPNGSFYCRNVGHVASIVPSSRVNDGICDCCDTSDEYQSGANCQNTCKELGAAAREEAQRRFELESQGYAAKLEYINQGMKAKLSHEDRLKALKIEEIEAESLRNEKEALKKAAEEPEKQSLEKYRLVEEENLRLKEEEEQKKREAEAVEAFDMLDSNQDGKLQISEIQTHLVFDQNKDGIVSEEEAKFFLHMDSEMEKSEFQATGWILMKPYFMKEQGVFQPPQQEEQQQGEEHHTETESERKAEDDDVGEDDEEETDEESAKTTTVAPTAPAYDPETQRLIQIANEARDAFDEADRRLRDVQREIHQLEETSRKDYGTNEEFQPLEGQCFEYSDREYTYKLCPFDHASQRPKNGGSETRLGSWDSWAGPADNHYSKMKYDKGVQCWNGPQRSVMVYLSCGLENVVTSVSEPNRCEYEMRFTSPAACDEPIKPTEDVHDEL